MVEESDKIVSLSIPFASSDHAILAYEVLAVDKELKGSGVHRDITTDGINLNVKFHGEDLKKLRVSVNAFLKNIILIVKTINLFPKD